MLYKTIAYRTTGAYIGGGQVGARDPPEMLLIYFFLFCGAPEGGLPSRRTG